MTSLSLGLYFNPHARVGRDSNDIIVVSKYRNFNPHARVGRDCGRWSENLVTDISIHTPAWGVTAILSAISVMLSDFNPHARVGRDPVQANCYRQQRTFQSTRPRGA